MGGSAIDPGSSHSYRTMLRALPIPACIYDAGTVQYANPEMARLLGAACAEDVAGTRLAQIFDGNSRAAFQTRVNRVMSGESLPPCRQRVVRADGSGVEVEIRCTAIHYEGQPAVLGVFTEARRERIAEVSGDRKSRRFAGMLNGLPSCILFARPSGRVVFANTYFLEYTGFRPGDVLRSGWLEALSPDDRAACRTEWKRSIETGQTFDAEFRVRRRDGLYRWHHGAAEPLRAADGRILRWCVKLDDIERYKRGEALLSVSERRFRRLFEGNLVGLIIGTVGRLIEVNDMFLRIVGRTRVEFENGAVNWTTVIPPEETALGQRKFQELLRGGEVPPFEISFLRKDGTRVPVVIAAMLLAREPEVRVMALMVDVTERRHIEEIHAEKMKLDTVSLLAAGMAHNLNNLLTAVIGNASLLLDQHIGASNARAYSLVRDILSAGDRAANLVNKLLASAGQSQQGAPVIDIMEVVRGELERLRPTVPSNVSLRLEPAVRLPPVLIMPEQLQQVVEGLVTNGIEAIGDAPGGEVAVRLRVEHIGVKAAAERFAAEQLAAGDYCVLEVQDNGSGMDPATLVRIFDPFFTTKFMGRGLGLAAIAGIIRAARGAVRVGSTRGAGTIVRVFLPPAPALSGT